MEFNPQRLRLARQRRIITKKALAEGSGVTPQTLTRLEQGQWQSPNEGTVWALARTLDYPISFFYGEDLEEVSRDSVSFRSLATMGANQCYAALAAGALAYAIDDWIAQRFSMPELDTPDLRQESPELAAITLRHQWGIGYRPINELVKLLECKGVRVFSLSEQNKNVDAFSVWRDGIPYVFLNTHKSAERSRFDAAHELGHIVLHRHSGVYDKSDSTEKAFMEKEADRFASVFLMPPEDLMARIKKNPSLTELLKAKKRWRVSVAALARSCRDAGLVTDWHYRRLSIEISRKGYRKSEPNAIKRERSGIWSKVLTALWREGFDRNELSRILSFPKDEVENLLDGLIIDKEKELPPRAPPKLSLVSR